MSWQKPTRVCRRAWLGWGNLTVRDGALQAEIGYIEPQPPRYRAFTREREA